MQVKINDATISAICTDIDGTLLDSRRELSPRTIEVIRNIGLSMPVVLASSRMPAAMRHLQASLGILQYPLICYNGGYVVRYVEDMKEILFSAEISLKVCAAILALGRKSSVHISLYQGDQWLAPQMDQWGVREATITKVSPILKSGEEVLEQWERTGRGAHKVMIMGVASAISNIESCLRQDFGSEIHVYHSKSTYLEIAPKIISKASALQLSLQQLYNIPMSDVMAFGDNYNDIDLIRSVGFGVAVGNAREEVKAVAKEIAPDSKQDGVADIICKYLLSCR
jgi:Cof subfamily protein (haloacid dehalogenase superfamily)